jgi:hypothetical protein
MCNHSSQKAVNLESTHLASDTYFSSYSHFLKLTIPIGAWIVFWLHQPNPAEMGLRATGAKKHVGGRVDIENLVKFTLDTLVLVVYLPMMERKIHSKPVKPFGMKAMTNWSFLPCLLGYKSINLYQSPSLLIILNGLCRKFMTIGFS